MARVNSGELVRLSPLVQRLTANNPGMLTGAGTNCYLIGNNELAILDPGPADPLHIQAILNAVGDAAVRWIVVTHTHPDHSPAAAVLAERTGAPLVGSVLPNDPQQDASFVAGRAICHGDVIEGKGFTLEAIATPGHVSNHFCYLLREEGTVFTGDHVMEGSTVVIVPPAGDMADYLHSLSILKNYPLQSLLPGHGDVMLNPIAAIDGLIAHRLQREGKVIAALRAEGIASIDTLVSAVYSDVDASLHPIAKVSLWAHLLKLEKDGCAKKEGEVVDWDFSQQHWHWQESA